MLGWVGVRGGPKGTVDQTALNPSRGPGGKFAFHPELECGDPVNALPLSESLIKGSLLRWSLIRTRV